MPLVRGWRLRIQRRRAAQVWSGLPLHVCLPRADHRALAASACRSTCLQKHKRSSKDKRSKKKKRRHSSSSDSSSSSSGSSGSDSSSSDSSDQDYGGMGSPVRLSKFLSM